MRPYQLGLRMRKLISQNNEHGEILSEVQAQIRRYHHALVAINHYKSSPQPFNKSDKQLINEMASIAHDALYGTSRTQD